MVHGTLTGLVLKEVLLLSSIFFLCNGLGTSLKYRVLELIKNSIPNDQSAIELTEKYLMVDNCSIIGFKTKECENEIFGDSKRF